MYKIDWTQLPKEKYNNFIKTLDEINHDNTKEYYDLNNDVLGCVRIGEVCLDIVLVIDVPKNEAFYLCDFYVYGIGNYDVTNDGTPYEQFDGFCYEANPFVTYEEFQQDINQEIKEILDDAPFREKAKKETLFW